MYRQIKHCNRIIEGLSSKEAIPNDLILERHLPKGGVLIWEKNENQTQGDDNINKHCFLVITNMHH